MRTNLRLICACGLAGWTIVAAAGFEFEQVRERARQTALRPFIPPKESLPDAISNLSYVEYRNIEFQHTNALWAKDRLPFQLEFFHPGYVHKRIVPINEIDENGTRPIPFSSKLFSYGTNRFRPPEDLGFAGFRATYSARQFGEVASFLGASYFRMIGRGQTYGTSARGIAVNTGLAEKEEFPDFREFWIRKPHRADTNLTIFALLDGPSLAGAYRFVVEPGISTRAVVTASLFLRRPIKQLGIASLTSMFLHDQNSHPPFGDFRPEVHDADGLLMQTGRGEWIWRPFDWRKMIRLNAYQDENPRGFGLLQRDRNFDHFQDLVAKFQLRPSVWIKPLGPWGRGAVQLAQLPSAREFSDNVVAFWVPAQPPNPGAAFEFSYEIAWQTNQVGSLGRVRDMYIGDVIEEPLPNPPRLRFVIDFEGLAENEQLQADVRCGEGAQFVADTVLKNALNSTWRLVIEITKPSRAVDLRATLKAGARAVTETWTYTWQP